MGGETYGGVVGVSNELLVVAGIDLKNGRALRVKTCLSGRQRSECGRDGGEKGGLMHREEFQCLSLRSSVDVEAPIVMT